MEFSSQITHKLLPNGPKLLPNGPKYIHWSHRGVYIHWSLKGVYIRWSLRGVYTLEYNGLRALGCAPLRPASPNTPCLT